MTSKNLNPRSTELLSPTQMKGLLRLGDVVIPGVPARKSASGSLTSGGGALPSFSESGCAAGIDRMLSYMYDDDRNAFIILATVAAHAPRPLVRLIVAMANANANFHDPLGVLMRIANHGIKGVVHSRYYSILGGRLGDELTDPPLIARCSNPNQLPNIHRA